jgi:hypothetical protein
VVQERVGLEVERQYAPLRSTASERIVLTGEIAWHSAERNALKSCVPTSASGRTAHGVAVEAAKGPSGEAAFERRPHRRFEQQVCVAAPARAGPRVKALRNEAAPLHRDVGRQIAIGATRPGVGRARDLGVEMNDLVQRMDAGVGAAGADRADGPSAKVPSAASTRSCTVRPFGWLCHPL